MLFKQQNENLINGIWACGDLSFLRNKDDQKITAFGKNFSNLPNNLQKVVGNNISNVYIVKILNEWPPYNIFKFSLIYSS